MIARRLVAGVVALTAMALLFVQIAAYPTLRFLDVSTSPSGACALRVDDAGAAPRAAGLRNGDVIDLRALDFRSRAVLATGIAPAGSSVVLRVERGGAQVTTKPIPVDHRVAPALFWGAIAVAAMFVLVGAFVALRGRDMAAATMAVFLCGVGPVLWNHVEAPSPGLAIAVALLFNVLAMGGFFALYLLAEIFSAGLLSATALRISRTLEGLAVVYLLAGQPAEVLRITTGCNYAAALQPAAFVANVMLIGLPLVLMGYALQRAPAHRRRQLRWMGFAMIVGLLGPVISVLFVAAGVPVPLDGFYNLLMVVVPLGCAYAVLRHRVVDVGFVINRALVYGTIAALVLVVFTLVEGVVDHFAAGRATSLAIELLVTLLLGLSFTAIEKRVEGVVERLFFRRQRQAEESLRALARDVPHYEDAAALIARVVEEVQRTMRPTAVAAYQVVSGSYVRTARAGGEARGWPPRIDPDDPTFVRLRSTLSPTELADVPGALGDGGVVFPMAVRHRVIGALVCAPRPENEPFEPNEREVIAHLAHEVGAGLLLLENRARDAFIADVALGAVDGGTVRDRARGFLLLHDAE